MNQSQLILGYFDVRGIAQPVRNLLAYLAIPYEDKRYTDRSVWLEKDKISLKTDFPTCPYIIDGDKTITESEALLYYVAFKAERSDLIGSTPEEQVHLTQIKGFLNDTKKAMYDVVTNKIDDPSKGFEEKLLPRLKQLANHLGKNEFIVGKISIADFILAEILSFIDVQDGDFVTRSGLKEYLNRFNSLKGVKEYLTSGKVPKYFVGAEYVHAKIKTETIY